MPKPGLWHKMLSKSYETQRLERQEARAEPNPELVKLTEMIEDAMRKEQMAEFHGTDTPVGDDDSCWETRLPLWDVKLGEVDPKTGRRTQPFEWKKQPFFWMACRYCQIGTGACVASTR